MAFAKKTWKDRIAEFPTRRRLTKEDNTSELVTVAREEGTLSQEGDAFSAENMNDLENRIDAEFTELNGKLLNITKVKVSFTKSSDGATVLIDGIKKGACIIAMRNVISNGTVATYITSALCDTDGVVKLYLNTNVSSVTTDVTIIWAN